jgi:hypothetical protein
VAGNPAEARLELRSNVVLAGHQREARLRPDDPAGHEEKRRPGAIPAFCYYTAVIVGEADDPVRRNFSALSLAAAITGCSLSRA